MTSGIVLSGGASTRMGQPKALLLIGKLSMAEHLLKLFSSFCQQTWLVTGAHHQEILNALPHFEPQITYNPLHASGMFSSLRHGLSQCQDADSILFSPVDFAAVQASSIAQLFAAPVQALVKPRWQGQSGHPILLRGSALDALRNADPSSNAKEVLSQIPATYIDVDDPGVAQDCDTPADYQRLLALVENQQ